MNKTLLTEMIEQKMVSVNKHPTANLYIYNYTPNAQYSSTWNEVTMMCRGLIMDNEFNIIQRPFSKFFNLGERPDEVIPNESFEVYDKKDGSLGILYFIDDIPYIASRGSFTSPQAQRGTKILHYKYLDVASKLDKTKTYLFEIIYPENRIVVDYGDVEDLFLLAIIDTASGKDEPLVDVGFPMVEKFDGLDLEKIREIQKENSEGFVIKFSGGLRLKVKFDEYLRIHKIVTNVSSITIWEHLSQGKDFGELINNIPDEFFNWVQKCIAELMEKYMEIEEEVNEAFRIFPTRRETAEYFKTKKHPHLLFAMLDEKDIEPMIWKMIKPEYKKPFNTLS